MRIDAENYSESPIETSQGQLEKWEVAARRNAEHAMEAQRRADAEAQARAAAEAQAIAEAERAAAAQFAAALAAAAEAEATTAPQVLLPTGDEGLGEAVVSETTDAQTEPGPYAQQLEAQLAGLAVPEDLRMAVDNLRRMTAEADALMAQGYSEQATAMLAAIQEASAPILAALAAAQPAPEPARVALETVQVAPEPAQVALETMQVAPEPAQVALETMQVVHVTLEAPDPVVAPPVEAPASPLDPSDLAAPNDYFTGSFDTPPPGGWFSGIGDPGRTGQEGGVYQWLPEVVATRAAASDHGAYLLAASDQVTSVGEHVADAAVYPVPFEITVGEKWNVTAQTQTRMLSRDEAIAELRNRGNDDSAIAAYLAEHESFLVQPAYPTGGEGSGDVPAVYGTRDAYLSAIGLGPSVPMDLQIAFNGSWSGGGDAWLDTSHAQSNPSVSGAPERAYVAIVDDRLAADYVQIGDIGPINDDVSQMLGEIYARYNATAPEQQEAIRNLLFKYDERFGVLGNREFIEAAVDKNNARRQGFFEGSLGRTLLTVAASFIPGAGPYVSMMVNAGFQLSDGASFGDVLTGAAISYFTQQYSASFGNYVARAFGESISPAIAEVVAAGARNLGSTAISQLVSGGGLDGKGLLLAAAAGGFGSFITNFVDGSDFGKALDAQFGTGRAGDIMGRLGAAMMANGKLSASDFASAFAAGRADQVSTVDGNDGTYVFVETDAGMVSFGPDGSTTVLEKRQDGAVVVTTYDKDGRAVAWADAYTGAAADPRSPVMFDDNGIPLLDPNGKPYSGFSPYGTDLDISEETYAFWADRAAARAPLIGSAVPDTVAAVGELAVVPISTTADGRYTAAGSGVLARAVYNGEPVVVLLSVNHVWLDDAQANILGEGGTGLLARARDGSMVDIPLGHVMSNMTVSDGGGISIGYSGDNAIWGDGVAVVLPQSTVEKLLSAADVSKLPALATSSPVTGDVAYAFGYPGFTNPYHGDKTSTVDARLLVGSSLTVEAGHTFEGENLGGNNLIATLNSSSQNPPQGHGSSGGALLGLDANGQVVLHGLYSRSLPNGSGLDAVTSGIVPVVADPNLVLQFDRGRPGRGGKP